MQFIKVENQKMVNDHYYWNRLEVEWFLCTPKMIYYKHGVWNDAMIGQIGHFWQHLESLLGAIELIVLCAFICRVGYFDAQIKETLFYKLEGWLTCLFGKYN